MYKFGLAQKANIRDLELFAFLCCFFLSFLYVVLLTVQPPIFLLGQFSLKRQGSDNFYLIIVSMHTFSYGGGEREKRGGGVKFFLNF